MINLAFGLVLALMMRWSAWSSCCVKLAVMECPCGWPRWTFKRRLTECVMSRVSLHFDAGLPVGYIELLQAMYRGQTASVRGSAPYFPVQRGVRQGYHKASLTLVLADRRHSA